MSDNRIDQGRRDFLSGSFLRYPQAGGQNYPLTGTGTVALDRRSCIAWADVICMSCQFACIDRAITFDRHNRPVIDNEACTGCGLCVDVCPSNSIRIHS
jgi:Pyruvate/2-oxoacid:ferredoxin oxidoreductase delta subunit